MTNAALPVNMLLMRIPHGEKIGIGAAVAVLGGVGYGIFAIPELPPEATPAPKVDFETQVIYSDGHREIKIGSVIFRDVCVGPDMLETIQTTNQTSQTLKAGGGTSGSITSLNGQRHQNYSGCEDGVLNELDSIAPTEQMATALQP